MNACKVATIAAARIMKLSNGIIRERFLPTYHPLRDPHQVFAASELIVMLAIYAKSNRHECPNRAAHAHAIANGEIAALVGLI